MDSKMFCCIIERFIYSFFRSAHNNCEAKRLEAMPCIYVTLHTLLLPSLLTKYILQLNPSSQSDISLNL